MQYIYIAPNSNKHNLGVSHRRKNKTTSNNKSSSDLDSNAIPINSFLLKHNTVHSFTVHYDLPVAVYHRKAKGQLRKPYPTLAMGCIKKVLSTIKNKQFQPHR